MTKSEARKIIRDENAVIKKKKVLDYEWYSPRSMFGNDWALFYILLGGREAGKSYAITEMFVRQWVKKKRPFYWLRLTEASQKKLLNNNAEKLIDPDIRRKLPFEITTRGDGVYETHRDAKGKITKKVLMGRVLALSTFYNDKGNGLFDADFLKDPNMYYNICLDEFAREKNEKNSFDIVYAFTNQLENLVRSTKKRCRVICIGNTLEEASDILTAFNFIPEEFGRFYLRKKRCVVEYLEPSQSYLERRKGTIADILMPDASTFTNKVDVDTSLITKKRLIKPNYVIVFGKEKDKKFTVWDGNVIKPYNNEKVVQVPMRPYLDLTYNLERVNNIIQLFDCRQFLFRNLVTQKLFKKQLSLLKPRK